MKKVIMVALSLILFLTACAPNFKKDEEVVQGTEEDSKETAIIPKYQISDQYYRTILPFKPSEARGVVVNNINTRHDLNEFETGLMRVALNSFSPDKYYFQEGQYLDGDTIRSWLNRKYTKAQLKDLKMNESENIGLNPMDDGKGSIEERNEKSPIILAHILEHNYLTKGSDDKVHLGGVVIGLALNSVHYYRKEKYGSIYDAEIDHKIVVQEGKKVASEVIKRLRGMEGLKDVPITIALFEQESRSSVVPGSFFAFAEVAKGSNSIGSWKDVNEKYYLFPSSNAEKDHRDDWMYFKNFKDDVEKYFPNFNGVVGKGFYVDKQLQQLSIDIPIQFYGKAEGVGFTQYVTGLILKHFPNYVNIQVSVSSVLGQEALIIRNAADDEPIVHIYK